MNAITTLKRPTDVRNAFRLLFTSLIIEILGFAFSGTYTWGNVLGVLIGAAITFFLMVKANEGYNWSRVVLAILVGLGLFTLLFTFSDSYLENPGETIIDAISTLITLVAVALLFSKPSNAWFSQPHNRPANS